MQRSPERQYATGCRTRPAPRPAASSGPTTQRQPARLRRVADQERGKRLQPVLLPEPPGRNPGAGGLPDLHRVPADPGRPQVRGRVVVPIAGRGAVRPSTAAAATAPSRTPGVPPRAPRKPDRNHARRCRSPQCRKDSRFFSSTSGTGRRGFFSSMVSCSRRSAIRQLARSMLKPFLTTIRSTAVSCRFSGNV